MVGHGNTQSNVGIGLESNTKHAKNHNDVGKHGSNTHGEGQKHKQGGESCEAYGNL